MKVKVNIDLSKQLKKNLITINDEIIKKVKKVLIEVALVDIESEAKKTLTSDGHVDTGRLRASIHTMYNNFNESFSYKNNIGESFTGKIKETPTDTQTYFDIYVGTDVNYATKIERLDGYLAPAFIKSKNKIKSELKNIIN